MNELNNPKRRKPNLADDDSDSHQLKKRKTLERAGHDWVNTTNRSSLNI